MFIKNDNLKLLFKSLYGMTKKSETILFPDLISLTLGGVAKIRTKLGQNHLEFFNWKFFAYSCS